MTIMGTTGNELTIGQHIQLAYQTLGVLEASQEPDEAQYTLGKRHLQLLLHGLERYGVFAHGVQAEVLAIDEDEATYDLPTNGVDIVGTAMFLRDGDDGNAELPVMPLTREEWYRIGAKESTGTPTAYYVNRQARTVSLWLIPDSDGTLAIQLQRKLADVTNRSATLDLEQYWDEWVNMALCAKLATSLSQYEKVGGFQGEADKLLELNRGRAKGKKANQIRLQHRVRV